ncbi:MAG: BON domain-containing protein [Betaproteobacteria bacterium]|nr:BON domain-containing protein [Betaproteobacteria bacterium]
MTLHRLIIAASLAASALVLQGCVGMAAVGVGTAALSINDRRTAGIQLEDENIEWKARKLQLENFKDAHVNITSFNLQLLLTGEVPNDKAKADLAASMAKIPSVKLVHNELNVAGNSSVASRSSDSLITASVKTRFIGNKTFSSNHVKVVTEAGTVFLMGMVSQAEADAAVEIARNTSGVAKVVRVFEITDPAKL